MHIIRRGFYLTRNISLQFDMYPFYIEAFAVAQTAAQYNLRPTNIIRMVELLMFMYKIYYSCISVDCIATCTNCAPLVSDLLLHSCGVDLV